MYRAFSILLPLFALGFLAACDSNDPDDVLEEVVAETVTSLPADPATGRDPNTGAPISTGRYTFFSLRDGTTVANSDSLTNKWDLGFRGTTIIVNGGTGRVGNAAAQIVSGTFEELTSAPTSGYNQDDGASLALSSGGGNGWYNYNPTTHLVTPVPGRVIVVRTADGRYAKVSIQSYYKDAPASPTQASESGYYTFRYVFQPDGSRSFESN